MYRWSTYNCAQYKLSDFVVLIRMSRTESWNYVCAKEYNDFEFFLNKESGSEMDAKLNPKTHL